MSGASASPLLVCPQSRQPLRLLAFDEACAAVAPGRLPGTNGPALLLDPPPAQVLLRADRRLAYPVIDGIPVLLSPEALAVEPIAGEADRGPHGSPAGSQPRFKLAADPRFAEAYAEMKHYNAVAAGHLRQLHRSTAAAAIAPALRAGAAERRSFPAPATCWLDLLYDMPAQQTAYRHLAPLNGKRLLQAGGSGLQAIVLLLAGAAEAWLASPMIGELRLARALAQLAGVADRLHCVAAVGEELPFVSACFDGIFCPGSLHHMQIGLAASEFARVLRPGGRLAACEPWRAPLYGLGTRLLGKVEPGIHCEVFTARRLHLFVRAFPGARVEHHGTLTRYPFVALGKLGRRPGRSVVWWLSRADDAICGRLPWLRRQGSSLAILATRHSG
ncbi:MAG TPA: methyltransferase domain-containing protein [Dehalococcoidia bacterium]|nr:methyltransferase domain-containing protein [Dehalococcoidia bacterium]